MSRKTRASDASNDKVKPQPVTSRQVHPDVWKEAMRAAGGDPRRIEVIAYNEAITHNHPVR